MSSQSTLRVLEVVQSLKKGGRTKRFSDTVAGLRAQKQKVIPLCLSQPEPWIKIPDLVLIEHERCSALALIFKIRTLIKKNNIQIIHAHCERSQLYVSIAGFICGIRTVGTFHRSDLNKYKPCTLNRLLKILLSDYVAVSHDRLSLLTKNLAFPVKNCHVVHGGSIIERAPTAATVSIARNTLHIPEKQMVLLSVGHLGQIKGHQDTICSLPSLIKDNKNIHLYIAGDGSKNEKENLYALARHLKLEAHITFLGQINNVSQWLEACDIFVQPSIEEAFGLVFAEAGAKSKPVISCDVGGIKEIIIDGETGYLVPPASPEKLTEVLKSLIDSPKKRKLLGENGYRRISTHFSIDGMVNKYLAIFSSIIK